MKIDKRLKILIQALIYVAVGYFIYDKLNGNIQSLFNYKVYSYTAIIIAIIVYSFHSIFNALNWHRLMVLIGENVRLMGQVDVYLRSFLLRYIPGNVVGILSRGVFNKKYGVSQVRSLWGWFLENIIYLLWAIVLGSYFVLKNITEFSPLVDFNDRLQIVFIAVVGFTIILSIVIALISLLKIGFLEKIFKKFLLPQLHKKHQSSYRNLEISRFGRLEMFLRYGLAWLIPSISFLLVVYGIVGLPIERPLELVSVNALAYAIGYIVIIAPSGVGVKEVVLVYALTNINGFSPADSVMIAIATRVVYILGELLTLGMFYPVFIHKGLKEQRND